MKTALILGGTRGLGKNLTDLHTENGWQVMAVGRSASSTTATCDLANLDGPHGVNSFLSNLEKLERENALIINRFLWVSGFIIQKEFSEFTPTEILSMADINLRNPLLIAHWVWNHMKRHDRESQFVTVASTTGLSDSPKPTETIYAATKAAQVSFTRALGKGLSPNSPIRVSLFCPGGMRTEFWEKTNLPSDTLKTFLDPKTVAQKIMQQLSDQTEPFLEVVIPRGSLH